MFLVALKQHEHDGKTHKPGDVYYLNDYYARQLIHLGLSKEVAAEDPIDPGPVPDEPEVPTLAIPRIKRKYQRRDMVPVK